MKVAEIFTSIQGESSLAGRPCTFVRLSGCNLRCSYCDTTRAYEGGSELSEEDIMLRVSEAGINLVEITGGEPLLQKEVFALIKRLLDAGYFVLVETNGSQSIREIDRRATVIMDVKTPGSGMHAGLEVSNLDFLKPSDEVKFVLTDRADYEWSKDFMKKHSLASRCAVLFSPSFGRLDPRALSGWIIKDRLPVRLNLQVHKYIPVP